MKRMCPLLAGVVVAMLVSPAWASMLFGLSYTGRIVEINPDASPATSQIVLDTGLSWYGATGFDNTSFLATPNGGSLYRVTVDATGVTPSLSLQAIGDYPSGVVINDLAYDTVSDKLYGTDYSRLYLIDPATAGAMLVGQMGTLVGAWAMDFESSTGRLLVVNQRGSSSSILWEVNPATAALTYVAPITGAGLITDIWYDKDANKTYGVRNSTGELYLINTTSGVAASMGTLNENVLGLGGVPDPVPEPTTGLLVLLAAGLPMMIRRRR